MKLNSLLTIFCLLLVACATNKAPQFKEAINQSNHLNKIQDIPLDKAVEFEGKEIKGELNEVDRMVKIDDEVSSYDLLKLTNLADGTHRVVIRSYCDCFGFAKYIAVPKLLALDKEKNLIELTLKEMKPVQPLFIGRFYIEASWDFKTAKIQDLFLMIGSSNKNLGDTAASLGVSSNFAQPGSITFFNISGIRVSSSPYGDYSVHLDNETK